MKWSVVILALPLLAQTAQPPGIGKPPIMKASEIKPGMKATAWTVFEGTVPEAVPVEIIGPLKNAWGPKQDIILGKMGGKAQRTNVAGGMSGSPVYIDGKLIGAVAFRLSVFSPDAICGITPIEQMLEINEMDESSPAESKSPGGAVKRAELRLPAEYASGGSTTLIPIETPISFSGFGEAALREYGGFFHQMGLTTAQGGSTAAIGSAKPAPGWRTALKPGEAISLVLVSGDMGMSVLCTVTYNDGRNVLGCGHPFLSLGPVSMPIAKSEVLLTLASAFQPGKLSNATEVAGALRQDRHNAIMGVLGEQAEMIPCRLKVRTMAGDGKPNRERDLRFQVFVQQKWTPFLMMVTLFNAVSQLNEMTEEMSYRISGNVEVEGQQKIALTNIFAPTETPVPTPIQMASWWGEKFNRLFLNNVRNPRLKNVDLTLDLIPRRQSATIESAFADTSEVAAGGEVAVKVWLHPYRGGRIERSIKLRIPAGYPKGEHRILLSDADTLNRIQSFAGQMNKFIDLPQAVSLINQERTNNKLYVSLVQAKPTVYVDDKTMPSLPPSVANVMQTGRSANRALFSIPETADEQLSLPFDVAVNGSYSLRVKVN